MSVIRLFDKSATTFSTQGIGVLNPTSCLVTEELNGLYEAELEIPITDLHYADLALQKIIVVKPNPYEAPEPFRIYQISRPIGGIVTVNAAHLSYDLSKYADKPFTASTLSSVMSKLKSESVETCPFTFNTDISATLDYEITTPRSIRSLLAGSEDSVLATFGGEWKFTGYTCYLYATRGTNRGVSIRYGINMTDIRQDENCANVYSKLYPFWTDSEGNLVEVTGKTITINANGNGTLVLDMSSYFKAQPTVQELTDAANDYILTTNLAAPVVSLDVKFAQTNLATETIYLGDTLGVFFPRLNVSTTARVVRTVFNPLVDRYEEMEVGQAQQTFAQTIADLGADSTTGIVGQSVIQQAVDKVAAMITGQIGGNITLRDTNSDGKIDNLLVMDTGSINTATKVFDWGAAGLRFSGNGVNGTFGKTLEGQAGGGVNGNLAKLNLNGHEREVGYIETGNSTVTTLASGSATTICSVALKKGTWIINAQFTMPVASTDTGRLYASITQSSSLTYDSYINLPVLGSAQSQAAINMMRILKLDVDGSVNLVVNQNTGSSKSLTATRNKLTAICIG